MTTALPVILALALLTAASGSQAQQAGPTDLAALKKLSILELGDIVVTSVSRNSEDLGGAAAAISVVTQQDIQRSGADSIPDALRGLPGIHVGQRNSNSWAVSSRGFSSITSEKLLVLSDTRSIYTPLFSGVQWDVQNYLMEDIDRIEVIRGPGATQWGSNAVNGVINITTRNARDTQGLYLQASGGSEERAVAARHGGRLGERGFFRVSGKYFDRETSHLADQSSPDDWHMGLGGFRADWEAGTADAFTLQGDWYQGGIGQIGPSISIVGKPGPPPPLRVKVRGGNVLGRWSRELGTGSQLQLRAYYDHTHRDDPTYHDDLDTIDLDFQHRVALASQQLTWGLNYRRMSNLSVGRGVFALDPPRAVDEVASGFVQDQIALHDSLHLTVGTKLEHNDFSGFEIQPGIRLAWRLPREQTLWAAVSRAVRVPTRLERDTAIEATDPGEDPAIFWLGNPDLQSEKLLAWELGYRWQATPRLALDLASFLNRYRDLASLELDPQYIGTDGRTVLPLRIRNQADGRTLGAEAMVSFSPTGNWRLTATYTFVDVDIDAEGLDINRLEFSEGSTPRHRFGLRSAMDLGNVRFDVFLRRLTAVHSDPQIVSGEGIPGYTELDLRMAYPWKQLEFAVAARNLLHAHHLEFGAEEQRGEMERSIHASITWRP